MTRKPGKSKSRNVNGYVRAVRSFQVLDVRIQAKEAELEPLRRRLALALEATRARYGRLTGGQLAEAQRILKEVGG
jgi:hypothetical protein